MSYAPNYSPTVGFATEESNSVAGRSTVRTVAVDNELANISSSINGLNANIKLLQRSDGKIIDGIIEPYQFSEQTRALISTGGTPKGPWASATAYQIGDCVQYLSVPYLCHTAHTSSAGFDYGMWMAISGDGQSFQYAVNAAASAAGAAISESNAVNAANGAAASAASTSTYATQASSYANAASNSATAAAASAVTAETMLANSISGASQAEAEAGTDNAKYMSALRVKQSIMINAQVFPSGTRLSFQQTAAPTGWTKDTTAAINDSILRFTTGTVGSGGSTAFSTWAAQSSTGATTLTAAQIPAHGHDFLRSSVQTNAFSSTNYIGAPPNTAGGAGGASNSVVIAANSGGGGSHSHSLSQNIKYYDFIIASKN